MTGSCLRKSVFAALGLGLLGLSACEARRVKEFSPLPSDQREYLVAVVLDLSGSYANLMLDGEGRAWKFFGALADRFFRDRSGSDDRIVIAQISAKEKSLLWEGTPAGLKRDFPNAKALKDYLRQKSDPGGSRVHDSVADMVDYLNNYPGVAEGKTQSALFVLSDMDDNLGDSQASQTRLLQSLETYARAKGVVGMYWVDHRLAGDWKRNLKKAGFRSFAVESEIVANPSLPAFDH